LRRARAVVKKKLNSTLSTGKPPSPKPRRAAATPGAAATRGPGRPKDPAKRHAIMIAASALFLERGYGEASMDAIAQAAQVSKLTLYSHFTDKAALFREVVRERVEHYAGEDTFARAMAKASMRERLETLAEGFLSLLLSDEATGLERLLIAGAGSHPEAGALFFEAGPQRVLQGFRDFFEEMQQQGAVTRDIAAEKLAEFFTSLLKGTTHMRVMIGQTVAARKEIRQHAADCVAFFLRAIEPR
jgi:TetR/AcrR family transcriptional repressor of mexJK operon